LPDAVAILRNNPPPPYQKNTNIPQPPRKPKVLTFQNVIYSKKEDSFVINIKDLSIYSGEIVAILGSNGAGKTTLLLLALGILEPTSGKIHRNFPSTLLNENLPTKAFWIPQEPEDALWQDSVRSVLETLTPNSFDTPHLSQIISRFSLQNLPPLHPRNLSGGEKARLLLASALLAQPAVLLADEPTRELDPRWYSEAQNLFRELAAAGSAILLATEDTELAAAIADRAIILQRGKIIASGPTHQILDDGIFYTSVENRIRKSLEK
ncbi:MAG: ATP-binding cassette domain-containing protein, partial [Chthoniobacterales bacterium]|nr:ATP-binding cassette domain-containing protein [Chthoniobacterales bacterium]